LESVTESIDGPDQCRIALGFASRPQPKVHKKLGLTVDSEKPDGERVYRVIEPQAA
jgi:hypothetical protein